MIDAANLGEPHKYPPKNHRLLNDLLKAAIGAVAANGGFVRLGDLTTSIMLQQRINVCFGEAALQRTRPTRTVVLGR
jgi:hypothetical protein